MKSRLTFAVLVLVMAMNFGAVAAPIQGALNSQEYDKSFGHYVIDNAIQVGKRIFYSACGTDHKEVIACHDFDSCLSAYTNYVNVASSSHDCSTANELRSKASRLTRAEATLGRTSALPRNP